MHMIAFLFGFIFLTNVFFPTLINYLTLQDHLFFFNLSIMLMLSYEAFWQPD